MVLLIAWVDVETTGLDPSRDMLLEVGFAITDDDLSVVDSTAVVIRQPLVEHLCRASGDVVYRMHLDNGLVSACRTSHYANYGLTDATFILIEWLRRRSLDHDFKLHDTPLAGSSVSFDRTWLAEKMPLLEMQFSYRNIDVSSIKELNRRWGFAPSWDGGRKIHRALPDIQDSIDELKLYRQHMGRRWTMGEDNGSGNFEETQTEEGSADTKVEVDVSTTEDRPAED